MRNCKYIESYDEKTQWEKRFDSRTTIR
ncbi:hypothetical protein AX774_g4885, partial [Zancudomyces culisetae]